MQSPSRKASATRSRAWDSSRLSGEEVSATTSFSTPKARAWAAVTHSLSWIESLSHDHAKLFTVPFQEPRICASAETIRSGKDHVIRPSSWSSTQRCAVPRPQRSLWARVVCAISSRPCSSSVSMSMTSSKHHRSPGPTGPGLMRRRLECLSGAQALGRLPWFAPFFLRARRLRPVLPMGSSYVDAPGDLPRSRRPSSQVRCDGANPATDRGTSNPGPAQSRRVISTCTWLIESITRWRRPSGATSEHERATRVFTVRSRS